MSNIIVLAGGASVIGVDLRNIHKAGVLIGVNDAAIYTRAHYAVSLCPRWIKNRLELLGTLGVPYAWLEQSGRPVTPPTPTGPTQVTWFLSDEDHLDVSYAPRMLAGRNSGHAAVNLALRVADAGDAIYVLGVDLGYERGLRSYWYPSYPWAQTAGQLDHYKYEDWRDKFEWLAEKAVQRGHRLRMVGDTAPVPHTDRISIKDFHDLIG